MPLAQVAMDLPRRSLHNPRRSDELRAPLCRSARLAKGAQQGASAVLLPQPTHLGHTLVHVADGLVVGVLDGVTISG